MFPMKMKQKMAARLFPSLFKLPMAMIPSSVFQILTFVSVLLSAILHINGKKHESLFVGQWAPVFLLLGIYRRFMKLAGF